MLFSLAACSPDEGGVFGSFDPNDPDDPQTGDGTWLIPQDEVFDGGPGKDGIPSIDEPVFIDPSEVTFLDDNDLVIAVAFDEVVKVYPHPILDWHEIVNDEIGEHYFALTYCPLTGTAVNWNREINGTVTEFGVSGLLYNSNLIPYDRLTNSNWSQIRLDCVNGELQGKVSPTYPVVETTWGAIKQVENLLVLSTETGFSRDYGRYPYGDYRTNDDFLIFPISNEDDRLGAKDRVLGIHMNGRTKAYSFENLFGEEEELLFDVFQGKEIAVIGNKSMNFMNAYFLESDRAYNVLRGQFPNILKDDRENVYDVFGRVSSGPDSDLRLQQPTSFIGYWFAWATFYPDIQLYQ